MSKIKGRLTITTNAIGSKSEGKIAILSAEDRKEYVLYRENQMPQDDTFFFPWDGKEIEIEGDIETHNRYVCVREIRLEDGEVISVPAVTQASLPLSSIFIDQPTSNAQPQTKVIGKRLPRKLKKLLKTKK